MWPALAVADAAAEHATKSTAIAANAKAGLMLSNSPGLQAHLAEHSREQQAECQVPTWLNASTARLFLET
jgi:hypothetical protein